MSFSVSRYFGASNGSLPKFNRAYQHWYENVADHNAYTHRNLCELQTVLVMTGVLNEAATPTHQGGQG
jgi:hypothetical protein